MVRTFPLFVLLLISALYTHNATSYRVQVAPEPWLARTLDALQRAVGYFQRNYDSIILDGMFGLRVAEGQIISALNYSRHAPVNSDVKKLLSRLQDESEYTIHHAIAYLQQHDITYFNVFESFISKPFLIAYSERPTHLLWLPRPKSQQQILEEQGGLIDIYDETAGDTCFSYLLGTGGIGRKCSIPDECAKMMTEDGMSGYSVTHQVLFFLMGQQIDCDVELSLLLPDMSLNNFYQHRCDRIYSEAEWKVADWKKDPSLQDKYTDFYQDLFLEQGVICGVLGYDRFLKPSWLSLVLDWQKHSGCFGSSHTTERTRPIRHLLVESELEDGCYSHKSGLGVAMLALYGNYLIRNDGQFTEQEE